jgi:hypothetical protein
MDLTEGSETSAKLNLTPWRHPQEHIQDSEHGENLKSRTLLPCYTLDEGISNMAIFNTNFDSIT